MASPLTVETTAEDAQLVSQNATYAKALDGTGYLGVVGTWLKVGQSYAATPLYSVWEAFLPFDTSAIPDDATVTAATLSIWKETDGSATDFVMKVYAYDFGATVTTADFRTQTQAAALTPLLASLTTVGGLAAGYDAFTSTADLSAAINKTGETRLIVVSDRFIAGSTPTGDEFVVTTHSGIATPRYAPKLVVTYTEAVAAPAVTTIDPAEGDVAGGTSVTITGTGFTGGATVAFGANAATDVVVASATSITCKSPAASGVALLAEDGSTLVTEDGNPLMLEVVSGGTVHVTVTEGATTSAATSADEFTYTGISAAPHPTGRFPVMSRVCRGMR